jgi:lysosomal acid lipase/cholesteryl ester hydrolase
MKHTELKEGIDGWDKDFWDFSWEEMAQYDLPAEIDHILATTSASDLSYIGHSQGTTQAFAAFSLPEFSEMADKVRLHIALAPVAFVGNTESVLFQLAGHLDVISNLALIPDVNVFGNNFLGAGAGSDMIKSLVPSLCSLFLGDCDTEERTGAAHESLFDSGMMGSLFGLPDMQHLNQSRIPVYLGHIPEGTSVKNLIHWSQAVKSNAFRPFDDGQGGGVEDYDLTNYRVPTVLVSGRKDPISNRKDIQKLVRWLAQSPGVLVRSKELESYDHNDFTISIDGDRVFFPFILDYLKDYACPAGSLAAAGPRAASLQSNQSENQGEEEEEEEITARRDSSWDFLIDALASPLADFTWDYFVEDLVGEASASAVKTETHSLLSFLAENSNNNNNLD